MEALTIRDLVTLLNKELLKGHDDYIVFVTDDEEGNGYHALWFEGQTAKEIEETEGKIIRKYIEDTNCDLSLLEDKDKAYYLG